MAKRKAKPTKESNEYDNVFKEKFNKNSLQVIRELLDEKFTNGGANQRRYQDDTKNVLV